MDLFSDTLKRPKLRPNRTETEVDRDRNETETETWTEWCAKNQTGPGPPNPSYIPLNLRSTTLIKRKDQTLLIMPHHLRKKKETKIVSHEKNWGGSHKYMSSGHTGLAYIH